MKSDLVCFNGKMTAFGDIELTPDILLSANFVYERIHTLGSKALHRDTHIELAEVAYSNLYGASAGLTQSMVDNEVKLLLESNRYPTEGSASVIMYLIPPQDGSKHPHRLLSCEKQLLYKGYTLWHTALETISLPYDYPLAPYRTAVSLAAHTYSGEFARRKGAGAALTLNFRRIVTGLGEYPLFAVVNNEIRTTPIGDGVADSVQRRLGIAACMGTGMILLQQAVEYGQLKEFDELFAVTPQGVVSIRSCDGHLYPTSSARKVADAMAGMTGARL